MTEIAAQERIAFRYELWRKAIHLSSAAFPLGYAWFLSREAVLATLIAGSAIALTIEVSRRTLKGGQIFERFTGPMLRAHERERAVGATWMLLGYALVVYVAPKPVAISAMCAVSLGDAVAALVGRSIGRVPLWSTGKTLEGATACFLATLASARWIGGLSFAAAAIAALAAVLAELPNGPGDDNLRVAFATAAAAYAGLLVFGMAASAVS